MTTLDGWTGGYIATKDIEQAVTVQDSTSFLYNMKVIPIGTDTVERITWVPNRQVLRRLNGDLDTVRDISSGSPYRSPDILSYTELNNTAQTIIRRNGPILGALTNVWSGYDGLSSWTINLSQDKHVRCYALYNFSNSPICWQRACNRSTPIGNYTRCISIGAGWNDEYKSASFNMAGYYREEGVLSPNINVTIHSSPRAAFLPNGDLSSDLLQAGFTSDCLGERPPATCNWDTSWDDGLNDELWSRSRDITTWEFTQNPEDISPDHPNISAIAIDFAPY